MSKVLIVLLMVVALLAGCTFPGKLKDPVPGAVQEYVDDKLPGKDFPSNNVSWLEMLIVLAGSVLTHEGRKKVRAWMNKPKGGT